MHHGITGIVAHKNLLNSVFIDFLRRKVNHFSQKIQFLVTFFGQKLIF